MNKHYLWTTQPRTTLSTLLSNTILLSTLLALTLLTGCSGSDSDKASTAATDAAPTTQAPAPAATQPATTQPAQPAAAPASAGNVPTSGKVIKAMHAGGYTYMQLENAGKEFWIAATMLNVKRNDQITWTSAAVMHNFKSSALRRTFDEILFVSAASVQK